MIHSSYYRPRVYPYNGADASTEIDRVQELTGATTLNRTKLEEVGRVGAVGWKRGNPTVALSLRQLEYGSLEFWRKLANKSDATNKIEFTDFKDAMVDVAGYETDDNGTFLGTMWYPKVRTNGFSVSIGDPDAVVERSFSLVGEDEIMLQNDNAYFIYKSFSASGGTNEAFTVNNPVPTQDPDNSGKYLFRVLRVRGTTTTELLYTTDYTFNSGTNALTVLTTTAGDTIKVYYSASGYISGASMFTDNDVDLAGINADCCSIYLATSQYVYRLQSVAVDVTFDRFDVKEIGNKDIVQRGIKTTTARVTLGRLLEQYTIEEVLRGETGTNFGKIDVREFTDDISLVVKVYSDNTKGTFLMGYRVDNMAPTGVDAGTPVNDYVKRNVTLEGDNGCITVTEGDLA